MIFGKNAGLMLKYQKAKAKMVEYDVSKQEYPHFPLNSNNYRIQQLMCCHDTQNAL